MTEQGTRPLKTFNITLRDVQWICHKNLNVVSIKRLKKTTQN